MRRRKKRSNLNKKASDTCLLIYLRHISQSAFDLQSECFVSLSYAVMPAAALAASRADEKEEEGEEQEGEFVFFCLTEPFSFCAFD